MPDGANMIVVSSITDCIPELSKFFELYIIAEAVDTLPPSPETHLFFVSTPSRWNYITIGEAPKNLASVIDDIAMYVSPSNRAIIPVSNIRYMIDRGVRNVSECLHHALHVAESVKIDDPTILYRVSDTDAHIFVFKRFERPKYVLFLAKPRKSVIANRETIEIEYFAEIQSHLLYSDRRTEFVFKLKL